MTLWLPSDKLQQLQVENASWMQRKSGKKQDLQSLVSKKAAACIKSHATGPVVPEADVQVAQGNSEEATLHLVELLNSLRLDIVVSILGDMEWSGNDSPWDTKPGHPLVF